MDVFLLGPVEARLDGRPVALGARKQRALLAMLALEAGRTVSTDRLAEGLWGDALPSSAPKMVQHYVSQLRRLGADIATRGRGYQLTLDGDVDRELAERLLSDGRPRDALALWRGAPLADVADEPFAGPRSVSWRSCGGAPRRRPSTWTSTRVDIARCWPSCAGSWTPSHCASASTRSACSPSTGLGARPRRLRPIRRRAHCWSSASASSRARNCGSWQHAVLVQDPVLALPRPAVAPRRPRRRRWALIAVALLVVLGVLALARPGGLVSLCAAHLPDQRAAR